MREWQPIETAPKISDDAECGDKGPYILLSNSEGCWVGCYYPRFISGYRPSNPWQSMMLNHQHMKKYVSLNPTHWMPLPSPPTTAAEPASPA